MVERVMNTMSAADEGESIKVNSIIMPLEATAHISPPHFSD